MKNAVAKNTESCSRAASSSDPVAARLFFSRMVDPEAFFPGGESVEVLRTELRRTAAPVASSLNDLLGEATAWSSSAAELFRNQQLPTDDAGHQVLVRKVALWWAPLGLTSGAWLQWLTSPANADQPLFLKILNLYAADIGAGRPGASRGHAYLSLLRQLRGADNAIPLARLTADHRIDSRAFHLPALLLLMSRRPDDFYAELIGADLCLRAVGMPPPLALVPRHLPIDWASIDYSSSREDGFSPLDECLAIAEYLQELSPEAASRVHLGFASTFSALRAQVDALHQELQKSLDPWFDMAELMKLRAREGSIYHERFQLAERPLQEWLNECRVNPWPFLDALANSKLVRRGRSHASPLVNGLVGERGRMFRIFSPDDLVVIKRWIDALTESASPRGAYEPEVSQPSDQSSLTQLPALIRTDSVLQRSPKNLREAYHWLVTRSETSALSDWCLKYISTWHARTLHRMGPDSIALPVEWKSDGLRPWLQSQHDKHAADFDEKIDAPLPSREAVVDDALQTSLLTLIDGSWLHGFTDYELATSEIGHLLFSTYWDELGNGEPALNHPRIYRETLREMGIDLPPTASLEFANWSGFREESFELPVYWLCIGRFPRTFLPEVLGLNLAMELSGVGGTYRRANKALRKYGFSTRFVDIHNTIDNVATGHSAWAADAIDTLMVSLPDSPGHGGRSETWHRVRTGYRSLNPPRGFMARRAGFSALFTAGRWRRSAAR